MCAMPVIKPSFAGGELSPSLYGRIDLAKWHIGLATARNGFINPRGGFYSRAGTAFVGHSRQTGRAYPPRLITYQFSVQQGICLEFGHQYLRFIVNGAFVTEATTAISGITQANPGVVHAVAHGYLSGDWVYLSAIGGMTQLNGRTLVVVRIDADHYSLTDVYGTPINTTAYGAYTAGGTAARLYTIATPYNEQDLPWLKWTQSADVMTLCCWNQASGTSYAQRELSRASDTSWTLGVITFASTIAAPSTCSGTANILNGGSVAPKPTDYQYVATAVSQANGDESVASPVADIPNSIDIALAAGSNNINASPVTGAAYYNFYKAPPAYNGKVPGGALFGYIGTAYSPSFVDSNIVPDFAQVPPLHQNPFAPGAIERVDVTGGGSNLGTVTWAITTASGSGFNGYPVIVNGSLVAFVVLDGGQNYAPADTIAFNGASFATGTATFTANPASNDSIVLNGVTWTFKTTRSGSNQTQLQGNLADTITQLAADLSASNNASLSVANYIASSGTVLTIQYATAGVGGNAYTTVSNQANCVMSGATLTGGATGVGSAPSATLAVGPTTGTYPSVVTYFQERAMFAGSPNLPDTYWLSQPGKFHNFDSRVPTIDSDAITGSPWSLQVNGIQFIQSMPGGAVVLTGLEAWQLTGPGGSSLNPQPLTPAGQQAQPQAFNGCHSHIPPIKIDYDINYVQAKGSIWRDLAYNFWTNIYTGSDLCYLSRHLFDGYQILEAAWCEEPNRLLWSVRADGVLASLTYYKQQDVMAWARHDTFGLFKSVTSVTEIPVDALYTAVQRFLAPGAAYVIERMDDRIWAQHENTWCVDCGLTTTLTYPSATLGVSLGGNAGAGIPNGITGLVGGAGYANATTTASLADPTGAGCVVTLTIVGGVVTAVGLAGGANYTSPQLVISDSAGVGSGASASVTLDNSATFVATGNVFSAPQVGYALRMGGGLAVITHFVSATTVIANVIRPIAQILTDGGNQPLPQTAGQWSIAPNTTTIGGLWHLIGNGVVGIADGAPLSQLIVDANGNVTLPFPASLVTLGLDFTPDFQTLYLDAGQPTEQGRRKKIAALSARFDASYVPGILAGENQPDGAAESPMQVEPPWAVSPAPAMTPLQLDLSNPNAPPYGSSVVPLYTGDARALIGGGWAEKGQVALRQTAPLPMCITAVMPEYLPGDLPDIDEPRQQGQKRAPLWGPAANRKAA